MQTSYSAFHMYGALLDKSVVWHARADMGFRCDAG